MINLYKIEYYRPAFTALFEIKRKSLTGWSTAQLAEAIGVQPSHITNVVKERNHFSSDQIYSIGTALRLNEEEIIYLDLLMEWERAENLKRKSQLHSLIQKKRNQKLRVNEELKISQIKLSVEETQIYYLDPNFELIHLYLGTKNAPIEPESIARIWELPIEYIADIIQFLKNKGLVEIRKNRWVVKPIHQLLPSSSPLCKPQQMLKRLRLIEALQKLPSSNVYTFSGALSMTEDTKLYIQGLFLEFLKKVETEVLKSEPENIYHMQFDLLPWLNLQKNSQT